MHVAAENVGEIVEHIAEEGGDHTQKQGGGENLAPLPVPLFEIDHAADELFAHHWHKPDAHHDAHGHYRRHRDILGRGELCELRPLKPHGAESVGRGRCLIGDGAHDAEPHPRKRDAELFGQADDADDDGQRRGHGEDRGAGRHAFELVHRHADLFRPPPCLNQKEQRLAQHRKDDDPREQEQDWVINTELHEHFPFLFECGVWSYEFGVKESSQSIS